MANKKDPQLVFVVAEDPREELEYGILYPNGRIEWFDKYNGRVKIFSKTGRDIAQREYEQTIRNMGLDLPIGQLQFVKRTITTSFGPPRLSKMDDPDLKDLS